MESFIQSFRFSHPDRCFSQSDAVVIQVNQVVCFFLSFFYYFYYDVISHADKLCLADVVFLSDLLDGIIHSVRSSSYSQLDSDSYTDVLVSQMQ